MAWILFAQMYCINNIYLDILRWMDMQRPPGYKMIFMLNSAEHKICPANKSQITNNCKFFLATHSWT